MNFFKAATLIIVLVAMLIQVSCKGAQTQQGLDNGNGKNERHPELSLPQDAKISAEVVLAGVFQDQIKYFYAHYGRIPQSYEEWRDSGFLIFTPWSGNPTQPARHVDYSPTVDKDAYGTFHYEALDAVSYNLEFVYKIDQTTKVVKFNRKYADPLEQLQNGTLPIAVEKGLTYMEAKADSYWALLGILQTWHSLTPNKQPASLLDLANDYVSLVPEGFRIPKGVETTGYFEYGLDLANGNEYALTDLKRSNFTNELTMSYWLGLKEPEKLIGQKFIVFSSKLLKEGYPGIFR